LDDCALLAPLFFLALKFVLLGVLVTEQSPKKQKKLDDPEEEDEELFERAREIAFSQMQRTDAAAGAEVGDKKKVVHFGKHKIEAWYSAPYPQVQSGTGCICPPPPRYCADLHPMRLKDSRNFPCMLCMA